MTKLFLAVSILLLTFFPESFDKEKKKKKEKARTEVSYHAEQALYGQFGYMNNVRWESLEKNMFRASFTAYGEQVSAFYTDDGRYIAHTIKRDITDLPIKLRVAISNKFEGKQLGEVIQVFSPEEACWYIEVQQPDGTEIWKGQSYGSLQRHQLNG